MATRCRLDIRDPSRTVCLEHASSARGPQAQFMTILGRREIEGCHQVPGAWGSRSGHGRPSSYRSLILGLLHGPDRRSPTSLRTRDKAPYTIPRSGLSVTYSRVRDAPWLICLLIIAAVGLAARGSSGLAWNW
jgi:hypothetical protein